MTCPFVVLSCQICLSQYGRGEFAPGIKLGDAGQYKCGHNMLLAHAKVYNLYHRVPQASLRGKTYAKVSGGNITMALNIEYLDPLTQVRWQLLASNLLEVDWHKIYCF